MIELPDILQVSAGTLAAMNKTLRAPLLVCILSVVVLCRLREGMPHLLCKSGCPARRRLVLLGLPGEPGQGACWRGGC